MYQLGKKESFEEKKNIDAVNEVRPETSWFYIILMPDMEEWRFWAGGRQSLWWVFFGIDWYSYNLLKWTSRQPLCGPISILPTTPSANHKKYSPTPPTSTSKPNNSNVNKIINPPNRTNRNFDKPPGENLVCPITGFPMPFKCAKKGSSILSQKKHR